MRRVSRLLFDNAGVFELFSAGLVIAFVKYFYLLTQYNNLSLWLQYLLEPLMQYWKFIGLNPPDNVSLLISFAPDVAVIVTTSVTLFVIEVQI